MIKNYVAFSPERLPFGVGRRLREVAACNLVLGEHCPGKIWEGFPEEA